MTNLVEVYQCMIDYKFPQLAGEEFPQKLAIYLPIVALIVRQLERSTKQVATDSHVRKVSQLELTNITS